MKVSDKVHPCPAQRCRDVDGNAVIVADDKPLCDFHVAKVSRAVVESPELYRRLADEMEPGRGSSADAKVRTSKTAPIPMNVSARALQDDMLAATRRAESTYRRRRGWSNGGYRRGREHPEIKGRCRFIAAHLDGVLAEDVTVGLELLRIKNEARSLLGLTAFIHRLPAPCPECDSMGLQREDGASWVRCRACGLTFDWDTFGLLVRILVDANDGVVEALLGPKNQRPRCEAVGPASGLRCRMHALHGCSHLARSDDLTTWETFR